MNQVKVKLWTGQYTVIVVSTLVLFVAFYMITSGFPTYITAISKNPALAGTMTTAFTVASLVTRFFAGVIIQKLNMKVMLLISLIYFMVTIGLCFFNDSIGFLIFIRVLQGIGFCILSTLLFTYASNLVPRSRLGEGLVFFAMATSIGMTLGSMVAISLLGAFTFKTLLFVTLLLMLLSLVGGLFVKNNKKEQPVTQKKASDEPFYKYIYDRHVLLPSFIVVFHYIAVSATINFMGAFGNETHIGGAISQFFTVQAITMIVIRTFSGRIFDRFGHKLLVIPAALSGAIGLILLWLSTNLGMVLVSGFFFGVAHAIMQPTMLAWAIGRVSPDKQVTANTMILLSMDVGMAAGSIGLGAAVGHIGYGRTFAFSAIFMVIILLVYLWGNRVKNEKPEKVRLKHSLE